MIGALLLISATAAVGQYDHVGKRLADAVIAGDAATLMDVSKTIVRSQRVSHRVWLGLETTTASTVITQLKSCQLGSVREMRQNLDGTYDREAEASSTWNCGVPATDHPIDEKEKGCYDLSYRLTSALDSKRLILMLLREDTWSVARCGVAPLKGMPVPLQKQEAKQTNG